MKFRDHKYTWERPYMAQKHQWSFRGPEGGLHLHVILMADQEKYPDPSCGLEFHYMRDPTGGREAPHHKQCWLLGGPCWHDGTSLYASETVWPRVERMLPDHDAIFRYLETIYDEHFAKEIEA